MRSPKEHHKSCICNHNTCGIEGSFSQPVNSLIVDADAKTFTLGSLNMLYPEGTCIIEITQGKRVEVWVNNV
ncbi:hypothetical protein Y032_0131g1627 [Ancylostoma ceylanicum]|uniref:Uncharacterized protein n=1 Tax=Ancylostoma ceylanicum TaxID=53326 RepID=A0A016T752_9BILA|nr:hypothetical protein Y032_0131g1627 [Ancylostoma ceylanicum]